MVGKRVCTSPEFSLHGVSWDRINWGKKTGLMGLTCEGWGGDSEWSMEPFHKPRTQRFLRMQGQPNGAPFCRNVWSHYSPMAGFPLGFS